MSDTNFPWNTSVMVFAFNNLGEILLKKAHGYWGAFLFQTIQDVDIREKTAKLISQELSAECSQKELCFQGLIEKSGVPTFIYSITVQHQHNADTLSSFAANELPDRTHKLDQDLLAKILKGENIGIAPAA